MMDTVILAGLSYHDEDNDVFVQPEGPLDKHRVTGYIAGHDHCMSFVQESEHGPTYPLAGNTAECCYPAYNLHKNPEGSVKFYVAKKNANDVKSGFASFTMGADYATIRMHDENGVTLFKSTKKRPKKNLGTNTHRPLIKSLVILS